MSNIDLLKLTNAPSKEVAQATMRLVDRIQNYPPHIQVAAAAVLFMQVCKVHRTEPHHVFTVVSNMTADTIHGERPEFRAMRLYVEHELS